METPRERLRHAIRLREQLAHHYADVALPVAKEVFEKRPR